MDKGNKAINRVIIILIYNPRPVAKTAAAIKKINKIVIFNSKPSKLEKCPLNQLVKKKIFMIHYQSKVLH